jgi:hypothetical protein
MVHCPSMGAGMDSSGVASRPRVFGIGLNKTGTSSLHEALVTLGYRSLHWGGATSPPLVSRAIQEGRPLLTYLDEHDALDAFSDIQPLVLRFAQLDEEYPGSRFIYTTRDLDGWLRSRTHHVKRNNVRQTRGKYVGSFLTVDIEEWTALWVEHDAHVRAHFADRPNDLLVMNIAGGDGYDVLCPFLGVPEPPLPFPWHLRGPVRRTGTARVAHWLSHPHRTRRATKAIASRSVKRPRANAS